MAKADAAAMVMAMVTEATRTTAATAAVVTVAAVTAVAAVATTTMVAAVTATAAGTDNNQLTSSWSSLCTTIGTWANPSD